MVLRVQVTEVDGLVARRDGNNVSMTVRGATGEEPSFSPDGVEFLKHDFRVVMSAIHAERSKDESLGVMDVSASALKGEAGTGE